MTTFANTLSVIFISGKCNITRKLNKIYKTNNQRSFYHYRQHHIFKTWVKVQSVIFLLCFYALTLFFKKRLSSFQFDYILKSSSGSVRFDSIFQKSVRVRFGSTPFFKNRFEFGSDRLEPNRTVIVRFGSVRFRSLLQTSQVDVYGLRRRSFTAIYDAVYDRTSPYISVLHGSVLRPYISVTVYGELR